MGHEQPLGWFSRMLMLAELVTATTLKYRLEFGQAASEPQKPKSNGQEREWRAHLEISQKIDHASRLRTLGDNEIGNRTDQCEIPSKRRRHSDHKPSALRVLQIRNE
jgi:hypothetical protein